jgi:hypothetical protein
MDSGNSSGGLEEAETSEPLLVSEDEDAVIDEEELRTHLAIAKTAKRWRNIRLLAGAIALLVLVGVFVRLSRYRRPFDCKTAFFFRISLVPFPLACKGMAAIILKI